MDGIVVSHPTKQGNVYERPVAAQATGRPVMFLTGLYGDKIPAYLAKAASASGAARRTLELLKAKRRHQRLDPNHVTSVSWAWLEIAKLFLGRSATRFNPWLDRLGRIQDALHDRAAVRWINTAGDSRRYGLFHGFQDSCLKSLLEARRRGLTTLYEVTSPPINDEDLGRLSSFVSPATLARVRRQNAEKIRGIQREAAAADYILVQSPFSLGFLRAAGLADKAIVQVDLGVDEQAFSPDPAFPEPAIGAPLKLAAVGQISLRKGSDLLADAIGRSDRSRVKLSVAGYVVDEVGRRCAEEFVRLGANYLGPVSDARLLQLYRESDALVIPSRSEGGCNVVMEALACGCPCLVSNAAISVIAHGRDGWVVPNNDALALTEAIGRLALDPRAAFEKRAAARAKALTHSWKNYHARLSACYERILAEPDRGRGRRPSGITAGRGTP